MHGQDALILHTFQNSQTVQPIPNCSQGDNFQKMLERKGSGVKTHVFQNTQLHGRKGDYY